MYQGTDGVYTIQLEDVTQDVEKFGYFQKIKKFKNKLFNTTYGKIGLILISITVGFITRIGVISAGKYNTFIDNICLTD